MNNECSIDTDLLDEFISSYPVFEYRILDTASLSVEPRIRTICETTCERYGSTWACPPAVGSLEECSERIKSYPKALFFSSVAEVSDIQNMEEGLATRGYHEEITENIGGFLKDQGFEIFILSTESCDICSECAYKSKEPCKNPHKMHPCLESHGVVVSDIAEENGMTFLLDVNTILWFSMILFRSSVQETPL